MSEAKLRDLKRTARLIALGRAEAQWLVTGSADFAPGLPLDLKSPAADHSLVALGLAVVERHVELRAMVLRPTHRLRLTDAGKLEYLRICAALETHTLQSVSNEEKPDKPPLRET